MVLKFSLIYKTKQSQLRSSFSTNGMSAKCLQTDSVAHILCESSSDPDGEGAGLNPECCPYLLKLTAWGRALSKMAMAMSSSVLGNGIWLFLSLRSEGIFPPFPWSVPRASFDQRNRTRGTLPALNLGLTKACNLGFCSLGHWLRLSCKETCPASLLMTHTDPKWPSWQPVPTTRQVRKPIVFH